MNTPVRARRARLSRFLRHVRRVCLAGWIVGLVTVFYLQYQANAESRWMEKKMAQLSGQLAEAARVNQQLHALVAKRERPDRIKRLVAEHLPALRPSLPEQIEPYGQADEVPPDYLLQPLPRPFTEVAAPLETPSDSLDRRHGRLLPPSLTAPDSIPGSMDSPPSPDSELAREGTDGPGGPGVVTSPAPFPSAPAAAPAAVR